MSSFLITAPTFLDDDIKSSKFGLLNSSIGVGTDTYKYYIL
jgi:hypothetical protein